LEECKKLHKEDKDKLNSLEKNYAGLKNNNNNLQLEFNKMNDVVCSSEQNNSSKLEISKC